MYGKFINIEMSTTQNSLKTIFPLKFDQHPPLIILETGDVQHRREHCEYGTIKMLYFIIIFIN